MKKAVGGALVPVQVPCRPTETLPPGGMTRFQSIAAIDTACPDWLNVALHALTIRWSPPKEKVSVQSVIGVGPVLVIVRPSTNPPVHVALVEMPTRHESAGLDPLGSGPGSDGGVTTVSALDCAERWPRPSWAETQKVYSVAGPIPDVMVTVVTL